MQVAWGKRRYPREKNVTPRRKLLHQREKHCTEENNVAKGGKAPYGALRRKAMHWRKNWCTEEKRQRKALRSYGQPKTLSFNECRERKMVGACRLPWGERRCTEEKNVALRRTTLHWEERRRSEENTVTLRRKALHWREKTLHWGEKRNIGEKHIALRRNKLWKALENIGIPQTLGSNSAQLGPT